MAGKMCQNVEETTINAQLETVFAYASGPEYLVEGIPSLLEVKDVEKRRRQRMELQIPNAPFTARS